MLKVSTLLSASVLLLTFGAFTGCGSNSKDSSNLARQMLQAKA